MKLVPDVAGKVETGSVLDFLIGWFCSRGRSLLLLLLLWVVYVSVRIPALAEV